VKTVFTVKKILDETGKPQRKEQSFKKFGISVTSARVTDVDPNTEFKKRMLLRQQAAADRAIAREQRIQEEEQRLLAIAKGESEVAERQAQAKVRQIEQTTNAETEKQLAITSANKLKEQAEIDRERSVILLEKAEISIQRVWAEAYAKRNVPTYIFGAGDGDTPTGGDQEAQLLQQLLAMEYAKRLDYDRAIQK
jgi:regulator of protease activity HflC (stomatin/prohibitin superfamily)